MTVYLLHGEIRRSGCHCLDERIDPRATRTPVTVTWQHPDPESTRTSDKRPPFEGALDYGCHTSCYLLVRLRDGHYEPVSPRAHHGEVLTDQGGDRLARIAARPLTAGEIAWMIS